MSELPTGWTLAALSELLTGIETGKSFKCDERPPSVGEVGVVKVSAVTWGSYREDESKTCLDPERINPALFVQPGDFLFSRANTIDLVGACVIAGGVSRRVMLSDKILRFRFADDGLKPWVLLYLRSRAGRQQIEALSSGNQESMRNIGQERIGQIRVPLPPLAERNRIDAKLDELLSDLDAGVAELKAAQAKLQRYRQSLLKAAVQGDLTAEWRASNEPAESGADLLQRILAERRSRWEAAKRAKAEAAGKPLSKGWQSKYPEPTAPASDRLWALPDDWAWASLDQLSESLRSGTAETSGREPTGHPVLKSSAVRPGVVDFGACNYLRPDQVRPENDLQSGDLLITRLSGSVEYVGCCAIVRQLPSVNMQYPDRIFCAKLLPAVQPMAETLVAFLSAGQARQRIEAAAKSTAGHKRISQSDLLPFPIPLPPLAEQTRIAELLAEQLAAADDQAKAITQALAQSTAQRQNILRAAFAGELVPQDPSDEPAAALLARIRAGRECSTSTGKAVSKPRAPRRASHPEAT